MFFFSALTETVYKTRNYGDFKHFTKLHAKKQTKIPNVMYSKNLPKLTAIFGSIFRQAF